MLERDKFERRMDRLFWFGIATNIIFGGIVIAGIIAAVWNAEEIWQLFLEAIRQIAAAVRGEAS